MNFKRSTTSMAIAIMVLSLISMTSIQQDVFATKSGMTITATADKGSDTITVTGMTFSGYTDVTFTVVSPIGNIVGIAQVTPDENGDFGTEFKVGLWTEDGFYTIQAKQGPGIYTLTVNVEVNNRMTENIFETESTLDGIFVPYQQKVTKDAGLVLDDIIIEYGSTMFEITGTTDRASQAITLTVIAPNGNVVSIAQVAASLDGEFTSVINVGGSMWKQDGFYTVKAYQNDNPKYSDSKQVDIKDGVVIPEFGTIAAMILAVAIISIIAISAKSRLGIIPRY